PRRAQRSRDRAGSVGGDPDGPRRRHRPTPEPSRPMKAIAQRRETASEDVLLGRVLCHDVRDATGKVAVPKGARVDAAAGRTLPSVPREAILLLALDAGDVHEEEAGRRLAAGVVGDGAEVRGYTGGQWTLAAARRGLLRIRTSALTDVNVHEGVSVFTVFD